MNYLGNTKIQSIQILLGRQKQLEIFFLLIIRLKQYSEISGWLVCPLDFNRAGELLNYQRG